MSHKLDIISSKVVQLVLDSQEAEASLYPSPYIGWMKFILLDDLPNGNKQRIPETEFANIIKSGINMPIKVAGGTIKPGHDSSFPIGVITDLQVEKNSIVGTAALWKEEREQDYLMLKNLYDSGIPLNVSWELRYKEAVASELEDDIVDLHGVHLTAATFVGIPAYKGRTRVLALASSKLTAEYLSQLPDSSFLYVDKDGNRYFPFQDKEGVVDLELVNECLNLLNSDDSEESFASEIQTKLITDAQKILKDYSNNTEEALEELEKLQSSFSELETKYKDLETKVAEKDELIASMASELEPLKTFKTEVELKEAAEQKFTAIKEKFTEAGLEMDDEYFAQRKETLLALSDDSVNFFITEVHALVSKDNEASASLLPKLFTNTSVEFKNPAEIARALRQQKSK